MKIKYRFFGLLLAVSLLFTGCANEAATELQENLRTQAKNVVEQATKQRSESVSDATEEETGTEAASISNGKYAYECLDEDTKQVYDEILETILNQDTDREISTLDTAVLDSAYRAVNADYGGLFWVSGYAYTQYLRNDELVGLEFTPKYTMDDTKRQEIQVQIDASVEQMLSGISVTDSDYAKAKYVYETLIENVDYVLESEDNQNIISVFLNRQTVCQGYASATQYLLNLLGIPSVIVTGTTNNESHAWNLVQLDGAYYYIDTTWGNSTYSDGEDAKFVNYDYLNITTAELLATHTITMDFALPDCASTEDNYYRKEGLYYTDWYPEEIGKHYKQAWENEKGNVAIKFADAALYQEAKKYFITEQHLGDFCEGLKSFYYLENEPQNILTITFG